MHMHADAHASPDRPALAQSADFGPKTALKVVDAVRARIRAGELRSAAQIKGALKGALVDVLTVPGGDLALPGARPGVVLVVGVNGGGKTTTIGKLAHKLRQEGASVRPSSNLALLFTRPSQSERRRELCSWAFGGTGRQQWRQESCALGHLVVLGGNNGGMSLHQDGMLWLICRLRHDCSPDG